MSKVEISPIIAFFLSAILVALALMSRLPTQIELILYIFSYLMVATPILYRAGVNIIKGQISDENFLIKICDPSNKQYYTKSCKYLSNYMKKANQLLIKTKVVDVKKLTEQNKNFDCDNKFSENILYCGLLGSDNNLSDNFLNLIYNEYLWYRLFMEYYSTNLSTNPDLSNLISNSNAEKLKDNKEKIIWLQQNNTKIKKALSDSLRTLSEIAQTFPLHIWFTMYQENANIFMKELSKIYPPIRTLADKLKNVQKTD